MKARQIFETVLYAKDCAAMMQFYADVLGLERIEGSALRCGNSVLLIFDPEVTHRTDRGVPTHGTQGPGHVAFAMPVADLESWREHLRAHGVAIEREVDWDEGGRSIYFRDPAGNCVELAPPTIWGGGWEF